MEFSPVIWSPTPIDKEIIPSSVSRYALIRRFGFHTMGITLFENTSLVERMDIVSREGKIVGNREEAHFRIHLYQVGDHYAELWYDPQKVRIEKIEEVCSDWMGLHYPEISL